MFGEQPSEGKPVLENDGKPLIADERTKTEETVVEGEEGKVGEEGDGKVEEKTADQIKTEEEAAAADTEKYPGKTPEEIVELKAKEETDRQQEETVENIRKEERLKFLQSFGVNSEEELKEKLNPKPELTAEQKAQQDEIYSASLAKYAIENKVFNNDEWLSFNNIKKLPDTDLVYNEFANSYKELNKNRQNEDGTANPVIEDEVKDKFNELYHIDSDNAVLKEQGQKNIELKAGAIRGPLQQKYDDVKSIYDNEIQQKQAVPAFREFMQKAMTEFIPDSFKYGEGDNEVTFDLTKLDKTEIEQHLVTNIGDREFTDFLKGKGSPEQRARIQKEITKEILYRSHKEIAKTAYDAGVSAGTKKGVQGSEHRFTEPGKEATRQAGVKVTEQDAAKIKSDFATV